MLSHPTAVAVPPTTAWQPAQTQPSTPRGLRARLAQLIARAGQAEAARGTDEGYWKAIARGL